MLTILIFIAILAVLILSHEFGHFIVAKKSGMRVEEFGFGFPPRIFGKKIGDTLYSINLLPIGGFVRIYGEDGSHRNEKDAFGAKPIWRRASVLVAGVIMNILVAYFLFSAGHALGTPTAVDDANTQNAQNVAVQIAGFSQDSPAQEAGMQLGDKIIRLTGQNQSQDISNVSQVQSFVDDHRGKEIIFTVQRGEETAQIPVLVRQDFPKEQGATGIQLVKVGLVKYPLSTAWIRGAETTANTTAAITVAFGNIIKSAVTEGSLPSDIAGPVGIATMTGTVRGLGVVYLLQFIALISLNLAVLNIIPFPALDGGRLAFLIAEKLKGSPVSKKVEGYAHSVGFAVLILLIILVTYKDIVRIL